MSDNIKDLAEKFAEKNPDQLRDMSAEYCEIELKLRQGKVIYSIVKSKHYKEQR